MRKRHASKIALVALASLLAACAVDQVMIGQLYTVNTPAAGACPGLTLNFFVNAQRVLNGTLSRAGQPPVANLSGPIDPDDNFQITAKSLAGNGTAQVIGRFTSQVSTISLRGDVAGPDCDGKTFKLRLGSYFHYQGGGGGGGG